MTMTIDELLARWGKNSVLSKNNPGVAEFFFRTHYPQLQGSSEEYARAFDVLSNTTPWPLLQNYERTLMTELIETTGLYATQAGKSLCVGRMETQHTESHRATVKYRRNAQYYECSFD